MFIFPGVGLGAIVSSASHVNDRMFYKAALALSGYVSDEHLAHGQVFPSIRDIRKVSVTVAAAVAKAAEEDHLTRHHRKDWYACCYKKVLWSRWICQDHGGARVPVDARVHAARMAHSRDGASPAV